jgi:peroxiredoxin
MTDEKIQPLAPDFTAADSEGKAVRLSDYRGKNNVVLIFNRGFF